MLFQINYSSSTTTTTLCCRREEEDSVLSPKCSSIRDEKSFFRRKKKHVGLLTDMMLLALSASLLSDLVLWPICFIFILVKQNWSRYSFQTQKPKFCHALLPKFCHALLPVWLIKVIIRKIRFSGVTLISDYLLGTSVWPCVSYVEVMYSTYLVLKGHVERSLETLEVTFRGHWGH